MNKENIRYDVFLQGESVDLIALTEEIAEKTNWYNWFNDEENMQYMQKHYFPNTKEEQLRFYKSEINGSNTKLQVGILHKADKVLIGTISLSQIDYLNRKCEIGGLIGEKKYKNIKYWLETNRLLIRHAVNTLNMRRIYGASISKEVSVFYERLLGFESEGMLKQDIYKNGRYNDVYLFGRIIDSKVS
jgi:ribosomal-protein-alanine N-acetyltransferase